MVKTHVGGGHIGKWRLPPLCHPQRTITIENHNLRVHTISTIYHTIFLHQNCHDIIFLYNMPLDYKKCSFFTRTLSFICILFCILFWCKHGHLVDWLGNNTSSYYPVPCRPTLDWIDTATCTCIFWPWVNNLILQQYNLILQQLVFQ